MLRCQAQLVLKLMMCLGDCSTFTSIGALSDRSTFTSTDAFNDRCTFTSTSVLSGQHDGSLPLFFGGLVVFQGCVCVCKSSSSLPPIFSPLEF
jgi:hypothetical protein